MAQSIRTMKWSKTWDMLRDTTVEETKATSVKLNSSKDLRNGIFSFILLLEFVYFTFIIFQRTYIFNKWYVGS